MISYPHSSSELKTFLEGELNSTGSFQDLLKAYYLTQVSQSVGSIQDLERQTLLENVSGNGTNSDLWSQYLSENSLSSISAWISQGGFSSFNTVLSNFTALSGEKPFAFHDFDRNVYGQPALGPELNDDTWPNKSSEWVDNSDGSFTVTNATTNVDLRDNTMVTSGTACRFEYTVSGDDVTVFEGHTSPIVRAAGTYVSYKLTNVPFFIFRASTGETVTVSNVSVKQVNTSLDPITAAVSDLLTISKGSAKKTLNTSGTFDTVAAGSAIARSYNTAVGKTGMLVEDVSENLLDYSIPGTGWTIIDGSVVDEGVGAVDGQNKKTFTATAQSGTQTPYVREPSFTVPSGESCAWAIVSDVSSGFNISLTTLSFDTSEDTIFDPASDTIHVSEHDDAGIIDLGSGNYLCYVVFTTTTDLTGGFQIGISERDDTILRITDPDGTETFTIHHAQVEDGSYPTSPIVTTGTTATRLADDVDGTDLLVNAVASADAFTVFLHASSVYASSNEYQLSLSADASNYVAIYRTTGGRISALCVDGGVTQFNFPTQAMSNGEEFKIALRVEENNSTLYLNGTRVGTVDTSCTVPTFDKVEIGRLNNANRVAQLNASNIAFYDTGLSDADLVGLTS